MTQATIGDLADLGELAYFEVDADRNVVAVSPAMERLTGFSAEDVLGGSCLKVHRCEQCLQGCGVFESGIVSDMPLTLFRKDGTEVAVTKSGRVFTDSSGKITGAIEVFRPTEEPQTSGSVRAAHLDQVLAGLGRLYVLADSELNVVDCSPRLCRTLGASPEAIHGVPLEELMGEALFGDDSPLRATIVSGQLVEGLRAVIRWADTEVPVSVTIGPIDEVDACGAPRARYVVMVRPDRRELEAPAFEGMVARSPAMQRIFRVIELLKHNDSTVLITGESGTGKELVAKALHNTSHRAGGPFVAVNCAAIPPELLESELFGHTRGAFTGAVRERPGRFELADGGTLFLDEIGDLALSLQGKILRFLQEHTFERVGDSATHKVDVRVVAATHVNLVEAVAQRRFREDLYYRLRVVPIEIPPLRERRDDLELLVRHLVDRIGRERGRSLKLSRSAGRALLRYTWPGNVRELENALEYAVTICDGQTIHIEDLPQELGSATFENSAKATTEDARPGTHGVTRPSSDGLTMLESLEMEQIWEALQASRHRRDEAAKSLGISRTTLWRKMKRYGLSRNVES